MKLKGSPINLNTYKVSEMLTNRHFHEFKMDEFEKIHLPESLKPFTDLNPLGTKEFVQDDNRGAVSTLPSLKMDGTDFYLSVKGIGSTTNPFSHQLLACGQQQASDVLPSGVEAGDRDRVAAGIELHRGVVAGRDVVERRRLVANATRGGSGRR